MKTHAVSASSRRERRWAGRWRALALAAALTLILVLLASAVFSIAARSREVASRSVALHSLNEGLRAAMVVRAQVTFGAYLAASDSANGTNSQADIRIAFAEARRNLIDLRTALSQAEASEALDAETTAALASFAAAANRTLAAAEGRQPTEARLLVGNRLVPAFSALRVSLVSQRDRALVDVKHAGSLLGRLGGLASFVIAFVLPTVTVLVYRQITRRSREFVEVARSLALERGRTRRRGQMLTRSLAELQEDLTRIEAAEEHTRTPTLRRLGWDLAALNTVIAGAGQLAFGDVDLGTELQAIASSLREMGIDVVSAGDGVAWADTAALAAAVRSLVLEAESSGARRIEIASSAGGEDVQIRVAHDGASLAPAVLALVFERAHDDERSAVEAGAAPMRLLAAQTLIEAMDGSLAHVSDPLGPAYVACLPGSGVPRVAVPADVRAAATVLA